MLQFFVQDQYQHEQHQRDVNQMEEGHQFQQENVYQNDKLELHRFYGLMGNDEMQAKLIVEGIQKELYNRLNYEYELEINSFHHHQNSEKNTYDELEESNR
jgi:hypothetical protein